MFALAEEPYNFERTNEEATNNGVVGDLEDFQAALANIIDRHGKKLLFLLNIHT